MGKITKTLIGALLAITLVSGIGYTAVGANDYFGHQAPDGKNSLTETGINHSGNTKVPEPAQIKQQLKQNLNQTKANGKSWIMNKGKSEQVIANLTLNEKIPLQAAFDFAEDNNLEVEQWSTLYDIGNHTYTGGYEVGSEETLKEAKERFYSQFEGFLTEGIEDLSRTMERYPEGTEQYQAAKKKLADFKQFHGSYIKEKTPLIYGIRVKSSADKIHSILNQQKINAVGKPEKGQAIYKEVPANWLEGADKINEKISN